MTKAMLRNEANGKASTMTASTSVGGNVVTVSENITWGGTTGGGAGGATLTISARRGQQQIAPEGIAFFADVEGFDAQPPEEGAVFDPTMHRITYIWDFGDDELTSRYLAPETIFPEWRNSRIGYGPFPSHVFTKEGEYTVSCTAIEKPSGKIATAVLFITVKGQSEFTAATTVVCSTSSTWTGAPVHDVANRTTTLEAALIRLEALKANGALCRLLLRGGEVFQMVKQNIIGSRYRNFYATAYGSGKATIEFQADEACFRVTSALLTTGASISRIHFVGPWDSTTETRINPAIPDGKAFGVYVDSGFCTVHDCTATGLWNAYITGGGLGLTAIFSNCQSTNWEDYGSYIADEVPPAGAPMTSYVSLLGCRLAQERNALQGANGKLMTDLGNRHGALRVMAVGYFYADGLDLFSRNGWGALGDPVRVPVDQNPIRDHRNDPRSKGFYSRIMAEGGWGGFATGSAVGTGHVPCNTLIDKAYFMGSARTVSSIGVSSTAFTARNFILHYPNIGTGADAPNEGINIVKSSPSQYLEGTTSEPVEIYNFSVINERDATQQARNNSNSSQWTAITEGDLMPAELVKVQNYIVHRPNFPGGTVADAPLDNTRLGYVPRYLGYRWKNHEKSNLGDNLTMDTSFATPADPWSLWRPTTGSPAIGSATGLVAYDDLLGNVRPTNASRGAVEPA